MEINTELRRLIHKAAPTHELRDQLHRQGILTLREEGVLLALEGRSSLEEVLTVTHSEDIAEENPPTSTRGHEVHMVEAAGAI